MLDRKGLKMKKIKMEFTINELNTINRALTGYEKDLEDLYEAIKVISTNALPLAKEILNVKRLNQRIRDDKWENIILKNIKEVVKGGK